MRRVSMQTAAAAIVAIAIAGCGSQGQGDTGGDGGQSAKATASADSSSSSSSLPRAHPQAIEPTAGVRAGGPSDPSGSVVVGDVHAHAPSAV